MFNTVNALVIRETKYKEADRILTLMTDREGKITVKARGALRKSSRTAAATQQLTYSEMTLFGNKGRWTVNEAVVKESFEGLRQDMDRLSLGCYFSECLEAVSVEDQPEPELLQLALNSLYALSRGLYPQEQIKAAFEMRLMCLAGYAPVLSACARCGAAEPEEAMMSLDNGTLCCRSCSGGMGDTAPLCRDSLAAMRHICSAPARQFLSFSLSDAALLRLGAAAERYLLKNTERRFSTLDYWKKIRSV